MTVSIIIVHYQVEKQLFDCLQSIYEKKSKNSFEVIVVDNDEKPSIEKDLTKRFPQVTYVKNETNTGYSSGNNLGVRYATGDFLFFLNPDTLFTNNVIDELVTALGMHKNVGIVAPLLFDKRGEPYPLQGAKELTPLRAIFALSFIQKLFPHNSIANDYWIKEWDKKERKEVEVVPGTAFMIAKDHFKKIGGFDENYFLYFEEHDLCKRVMDAGYTMFMIPTAHVTHFWGESTKKSRQNIKAIFEKSRFYYLRKFYGLPKALVSEGVLRFSKETVLLLGILLLATWLRLYAVERFLPFIGDFAWFYLSARDMLISGTIPLVGIASSHPWIHQGAFWTYLLAPVLLFSKFNPVFGGYLSGSIGVLTVLVLYLCTKEMFDRKTALFASAFFATSPLVVFHARLPYHTAPIPLFVILFLYCLYKWVKGNLNYFPLSLFFLVVLYNFELATAVFACLIFFLLGYGIYKKAPWIKKIWHRQIIALSFLAIVIPLVPMLFYDFSHGFPQTVMFVAWIGYRVLLLFGYPPLHPEIASQTMTDIISFLYMTVQTYYYASSPFLAFSIGIGSIVVFVMQLAKKPTVAYVLILLALLIPALAIMASKTPSDAYLPMLFAQTAMVVGIAFSILSQRLKTSSWTVGVLFFLLIFSNTFFLVTHSFLNDRGGALPDKIAVAKQIISESEGKEYSILGKGEGSKFESFTMPYIYLTWWLGYPASNKAQLKIDVSEDVKGIHVKKRDSGSSPE